MEPAQRGDGVANLPHAGTRSFRTLDDYLAFLEQRGAMDIPWWREVEPGVYELVSNLRSLEDPGPRRATRAELMGRYGFSR